MALAAALDARQVVDLGAIEFGRNLFSLPLEIIGHRDGSVTVETADLNHMGAMVELGPPQLTLVLLDPHDRRGTHLVALAARLGQRADFLPSRLSGGERQRTAVARSLVGSPRVLLCDEATGNLDSTTTASILDLFAELHRIGTTIVMITHEHDVAARARRQVRIVDGHLHELT